MVNKKTYALELNNIQKSFYRNKVLKNVSVKVEYGSITGLLGGNGAGKSTLMKIVNGVYKIDSGEIFVDGKPITITKPADAVSHGISMVYQELSLIPTLRVVENLYLNAEPKKGLSIDIKRCVKEAKKVFKDFGIENIDINAVTGNLSIGEQQLVEIIKALLKNPRILILDEPTASLTQKECNLLFDFLNKLKKRNIAIIFISHHMQEVMRICDKAVILRNGEVALDEKVSNLTVETMIKAMVDSEIGKENIRKSKSIDRSTEPLLRTKNLQSSDERLRGVNLSIYKGEVLGIAGLMGSGRTELVRCIFGLQKPSEGEVFLKDERITKIKPWNLIKKGIFMIPEDRRSLGIVGIHSIKMNLFMPVWNRFSKFSLINDKKADKCAEDIIKNLAVRTTGIKQILNNLSGGNQQKIVFGRSMFVNPSVLLLDDPTVGVDVEAKDSICQIISQIADSGSGVLLISSEFDQLAKVCDRVLIMKKGIISTELINGKDDISENSISVEVQS